MRTRWLAVGLMICVFGSGTWAFAQEGGKKFGSAKAGKRARNSANQQAGNPPTGEMAPGGPAAKGGFDLAAFTQEMFQQFDADGSGGLDQQELQNCLTALHQQVEQQNQAIAAAARQQAFMEMGAGGPGGRGGAGFGGMGGDGGNGGGFGGDGFGSADGQADSDQQQSSAFAEFSANSVNGQGRVQGRKGATGGGRAGGGANFGGGAQSSRGGASGGDGGRGGR